jgi:hypothetical protein
MGARWQSSRHSLFLGSLRDLTIFSMLKSACVSPFSLREVGPSPRSPRSDSALPRTYAWPGDGHPRRGASGSGVWFVRDLSICLRNDRPLDVCLRRADISRDDRQSAGLN